MLVEINSLKFLVSVIERLGNSVVIDGNFDMSIYKVYTLALDCTLAVPSSF